MKNIRIKFLVILLVILIIVAGALLAIKIIDAKNNNQTLTNEIISLGIDTGNKEEEEETINIYNGDTRPIAVMIDNHKGAWPQAGLNDAYMVYEIIVEGGESRLMALFKSEDADIVGPVRSARHYFLDYALENDAIYVHFGWSPQAQSDISSLGVNNINGLYYDKTSYFWRVKDKSSPHNVKASLTKLRELAEDKGYRTTSSATSVLNYVVEEVNLEEGTTANTVTIPYSDTQTVSYTYNEETKKYERYARGEIQTDWDTGEVVATKNIIITFAENYTLQDTENKGRQGLKNIGDKKGYYITNGKAIEIVCSKSSRTEKTVYKDLLGNVIDVNDGNTFVQICPIDAEVVIE